MNLSAAELESSLTTVSPSDPEVLYFGLWEYVSDESVADSRRSRNPYSACEIVFEGPIVRWWGTRGPAFGMAEVHLDGDLAITVDSYSPTEKRAQILFEKTGLDPGTLHTLRIVVLRVKHENAGDFFQGIDGFQVASLVDYPRLLRADTLKELQNIVAGKKDYLSPDLYKPPAPKAIAPEIGVSLTSGVFKELFERNIRYVLDTFQEPCTGGWVDGLPCSSEGRLLGAAGHSLRWQERADLRAVVDGVVEAVKIRQDADGYCFPYDREHMGPHINSYKDERRNYDRVNLTRGMIAAGRVGNPDALPVMRRFYDWLYESGYYPTMLSGPADGSGHNCNNGHAGSLLMYFSPVGKPEDMIAAERYFIQDFLIDEMLKSEPLALCYYPLHVSHCYVLLAFEAWLDHYKATGTGKYLNAALGAWEMVHRYYEHVGGTIAICEEYTGHYPPQSYFLTKHTGETCGNVFWADINHKLLQFFPDEERYAAEIEKSIYNAVMAAQDERGRIRYHNNLDGKKDEATRINTCCEVMAAPFIGRLPQFVYSTDDQGLWVHLFAASQISWQHEGRQVSLSAETDFPYDGKVDLSVFTDGPISMCLRIRVPSWAAGTVQIEVNGKAGGDYSAVGEPGSYVRLERTWSSGDSVAFKLPIEFRLNKYTGLEQHPERNRYALSYGPLLMALVGANGLDMTSADLPGALSPIEGSPLNFTIRGHDGCRYQPYWTVNDEEMTCFPTLK